MGRYKSVTVDEWHTDEDWSGGTHKRPGLERAISRAIAGETGGIVSWKIDRFSRQTEGGLRDLRRRQAADARLAFVVEDIDTGTIYGGMIYPILLAVPEAFLENVRAGWMTAKERAVARGANISRTPFGYRRREDGTLEPRPDQAPIVAEPFRCAASEDLRSALAYLRRSVSSRRWTTSTVRRRLSGRSYLGETRHGEQTQADTHGPLVSRWEAAQTTPARPRVGCLPAVWRSHVRHMRPTDGWQPRRQGTADLQMRRDGDQSRRREVLAGRRHHSRPH